MDDILQNLDFSSSSSDDEACAQKLSRATKLNQSEAAFLEQKARWRPVCQEKQALRNISTAVRAPETKEQAQTVKAAAEERYYARDYKRAAELAGLVLGSAAVDAVVHPSEKAEVEALVEACTRKMGRKP